jgi:hypothetical protein
MQDAEDEDIFDSAILLLFLFLAVLLHMFLRLHPATVLVAVLLYVIPLVIHKLQVFVKN